MDIRKNFEAVFIAATVITTFAAYATADAPAARSAAPVIAQAAGSANQMQVVVVKAKRLTAAEKAAMK
jgi:hypothetical protein